MWSRIVRLLSSTLNLYGFYTHPVRYIFSLLTIVLIPYLAYIFWGSLIIIVLSGLGIYFLYRLIKEAWNESAYLL